MKDTRWSETKGMIEAQGMGKADLKFN